MNMKQHLLRKLYGAIYATEALNKFLALNKKFSTPKIITWSTIKGGPGKTSGSTNFALNLILLGYKVLFVDSDPQGNSSSCFGYNDEYQGYTLSDALTKKCTPDELVNTFPLSYYFRGKENPIGEIDIIYATRVLSTVADVLVNDQSHRDDTHFKNIIGSLQHKYDFIIYDTNPTINVLLRNVLNHANFVIIPTQLEKFAIDGFGDLLEEISNSDNSPDILGLLPIRYKKCWLHDKYLVDFKNDNYFEPLLFNTKIRDAIAVAEAQASNENVLSYAPSSKVAQDIANFTLEALERLGGYND